MHRYISVAHHRSPFSASSIPFGGLGDYVGSSWPRGRSYQDVSNFRAPYDDGYYQSNSLFGLGADTVPVEMQQVMPADFRRYLQTGEPMPELMRDVGTASAQIPRWAWGGVAAVSLLLAWRGYKRWKKTRRAGS